jgi:signal transduction histidine kinase/ligand-binding sensor domain-containing protein/CheY-like chemotaxis protein
MIRSKNRFIIVAFLLLLLFLLIPDPLSAQAPGLNFRYLTTRDGLSSDDVRYIYQDKDGFMWFGCEGGLDRYDGKSFISFYDNVRDTAFNYMQPIQAICEDSYGGMWFGNDTNGLVLMNKKTEKFIRFRHNDADPLSIASNNVRKILEDSHRNLWIVSLDGGLNSFNRHDSTFERFQHDSTDKASIGSNYITTIAEDHSGNIWLTSLDGLLIRFDPEKRKFENISLKQGFPFFQGLFILSVLYIDVDDNIWFADGQSLFRYNHTDKSLKQFNLKNEEGVLTFSLVTSMIELEEDKFLVSTNRTGLFEFNSKTGKFLNYVHNPANPYGISSNRLSQIFKSRDDVVWIATNDNGINVYSKNALRFPQLINLVAPEYLEFSGHSTYCLIETPDGQILMGTENNGIFVYNPRNKSLQQFIPELSDYSIYDLYMDAQKNLWICTWFNGLYCYDWNKKRLKRINNPSVNSSSIIGNNAVRIIEDHSNRLWIGSMSEGVNMFDRTTKASVKFSFNPKDTNSLSSNLIYKIFEDSRRNIWIGTSYGLNLFNKRKNSFVRLPLANENGKNIYGAAIYDIYEDSEKRIWIASNHTLHLYDRKSGSLKCFSQKINGIYVSVQKILEDKNHHLWLGTSKGISSFDPETGSFKNFGKSDGIHYLTNNPTAGLLSREGYLYFGTSKGVTIFNPKTITDDTIVPPVFITGLRVNDLQISPQLKNPFTSQSIIYTDVIKLNYKQSTLSITFASLNFNNPETNQYKYQLVGFDKDWVNAENSNTAYYANLSPGRYVFKIIASNGHGLWNTTGKQMVIIIRPPAWGTIWFKILAVLVISSIILFIYFSRIHGLQHQKVMLEGIVNQRTKDLNNANKSLTEQHEELIQQHEEISSQNELLTRMSDEILAQNAELEQHRFNLEKLVEERTKELEIAKHKAEESDQLKSAFLANMSHEIRTPMNAIVGFANLLKEGNLMEAEKIEFIDVINANSEILLVLIDDILDLSLIEADQLTIRKEVIALNEILDYLYSSYSLMNRKKKLDIKLNNELHDNNLKIYSDRIRIKQILSNLLNNAYKFTEKGTIELGLKKKDENLIFYVKDTGIGIDKNDVDKVFERFRKSDVKNSALYRGTGLGLAISKALTRLLGGHLDVESTLGQGSTFYFILSDSVISYEETAIVPTTAQIDVQNWNDKNILIVEDERANYLYVMKMLGKMDVNIHWAENGAEAVKLASSEIHFHLILMDIKMPVMDGFEATKIIKSIIPKQVIIALTAYARPEDRTHFMKAGFDDYLSKPIKPNDFMEVIKRYI